MQFHKVCGPSGLKALGTTCDEADAEVLSNSTLLSTVELTSSLELTGELIRTLVSTAEFISLCTSTGLETLTGSFPANGLVSGTASTPRLVFTDMF